MTADKAKGKLPSRVSGARSVSGGLLDYASAFANGWAAIADEITGLELEGGDATVGDRVMGDPHRVRRA